MHRQGHALCVGDGALVPSLARAVFSSASTPSGLRNGAASSDRIDIANAASIQTISPWSAGGWFQLNTFANTLPRIFNKGSTDEKRFLFNSSSGDLNAVQVRSGGAASSTTSTGFVTLGVPQFLVATYADGDVMRIYRGSVVSPPSEASYASQSNNGTTATSDAGSALTIMNRSTVTTANRAMVGVGWTFQLVAAQLTPAQISEWWQTGRPPSPGLVVDLDLSADGNLTVLDRSGFGNHGLVTGSVPAGLPLPTLAPKRSPRWF